MDEQKARWARIVAMRDAGATFSAIGQAFSITRGRAGVLYRRGLKEAEPRMPIDKVTATTPIANLPVGKDARTALLHYGLPLAELMDRDRHKLHPELLRLPTCNSRALREIEAVLDACRANTTR
ncbi:MAG: hypothetical protein ABIS51_03560 [Sphingomonas sp.]